VEASADAVDRAKPILTVEHLAQGGATWNGLRPDDGCHHRQENPRSHGWPKLMVGVPMIMTPSELWAKTMID
jgi:hypothetical protein